MPVPCLVLYPAQRTGADTVSVFDETAQNVTYTFEQRQQS